MLPSMSVVAAFEHHGSNHVPNFKKDNSALLSNYRPISLLINFSKVFESVVHEHVLHYFELKLNSCQSGFVKTKSNVKNLVTYLHYISPLVTSQHPVAAIHFYLGTVKQFTLLHILLFCRNLALWALQWFFN
jgi:hypothetical protein